VPGVSSHGPGDATLDLTSHLTPTLLVLSAQVVLSSSIMYNNYVTIAQRRHRAQVEREHRERIQVRPAAPRSAASAAPVAPVALYL
jgi:hypothetical protein